MPRCNKAKYCVTGPAKTIINRTHKKNDKNRQSGQVRGRTKVQDKRPEFAPAFFFGPARASILRNVSNA
jgi:hypothetical protein